MRHSSSYHGSSYHSSSAQWDNNESDMRTIVGAIKLDKKRLVKERERKEKERQEKIIKEREGDDSFLRNTIIGGISMLTSGPTKTLPTPSPIPPTPVPTPPDFKELKTQINKEYSKIIELALKHGFDGFRGFDLALDYADNQENVEKFAQQYEKFRNDLIKNFPKSWFIF